MCQLKSGIILKDRIFVPDYDSHTDMLEELKIKDTKENAERLFIRAELIPPNGDAFAPVEHWKFRVDQDILPEWYVEEVDKERFIEAVKVWAKKHIHIGVDGLKITSGQDHYIKDCKDVEICDYANIEGVYGHANIKRVYGHANIERVCDYANIEDVCDYANIEGVYGHANIKRVYDHANIEDVCDYANIENVYDHANIERVCDYANIEDVCDYANIENVYDHANIKCAKGYSTIISSKYGWNNKETLIISDNATFKDLQTKTIWQAGDWTLKTVEVTK